jgi:hypothetical protein
VLYGGCVAAFVAFGIFHAWTLPSADLGGNLFVTALCLFGLFIAYYVVATAFRKRVILGDSSIEVVSLFGTRRIAYVDIAAKVRLPAEGPIWAPSTWALVSADGSRGPVRFDMGYGFDQSFRDWLAAVPEGEPKLLKRPRR